MTFEEMQLLAMEWHNRIITAIRGGLASARSVGDKDSDAGIRLTKAAEKAICTAIGVGPHLLIPGMFRYEPKAFELQYSMVKNQALALITITLPKMVLGSLSYDPMVCSDYKIIVSVNSDHLLFVKVFPFPMSFRPLTSKRGLLDKKSTVAKSRAPRKSVNKSKNTQSSPTTPKAVAEGDSNKNTMQEGAQ